jgi:hypothetical protein
MGLHIYLVSPEDNISYPAGTTSVTLSARGKHLATTRIGIEGDGSLRFYGSGKISFMEV